MIALLLYGVLPGAADPGPPGWLQVAQPDGTPLTVRHVGDCWNPRVEDGAGYTLYGTATAAGTRWELADVVGDRLVPTGYRPGDLDPAVLGLVPHLAPPLRAPPRRLPLHRAAGAAGPLMPSARHRRPLVILVAFPGGPPPGVPGNQYSAAQFADLLFAEQLDPADQGLPPAYRVSMRDYYELLSDGQHVIEGSVADVVDWVTAPEAYSWYVDGQQGLGGYPQNAGGLLHDVAALVDDDVDFSQYDGDGDGVVDHVVLVVEGWANGAQNLFWPHMSRTPEELRVDGVDLLSYYVVNESEFFGHGAEVQVGDIHPLGTFAHEMGHALGLPDLYDTDYSSSGVGQWDLMGAGAHFSPVRPAAMGAWSRVRLGWQVPDDAPEGSSSASLAAVADGATVTRIWADPYRSSDYFLVENRQIRGIDAGLEGTGGLIIWRIDDRRSDRYPLDNDVNADEPRYAIGVLQADGAAHLEAGINQGDGGDPYPGFTNNRELTEVSDPNSDTVDGDPSGVRITNISDSAATMGADIVAPPTAGFTLRYDDFASDWTADWGDNHVRVHFSSAAHGVVDGVRIWSTEAGQDVQISFLASDADGEAGAVLYQSNGTLAGTGWVDVPIDDIVNIGGERLLQVQLAGSFPVAYDGGGVLDDRSWWSPDGVDWQALPGDANLRLLVGDRVDHDGDGYTPRDGDCDETRDEAHPGAAEVCNGFDDDCDGQLTPEDQQDLDADGLPDCIDDDIDGDGVPNGDDVDPTDPEVLCGDADGDTCDDCNKGFPGDPDDDGPDADDDGICNKGDQCEGDDASGDHDGDGTCDDLDPATPGSATDAESKKGCGCSATPAAGWWWGLALLALVRRRKR